MNRVFGKVQEGIKFCSFHNYFSKNRNISLYVLSEDNNIKIPFYGAQFCMVSVEKVEFLVSHGQSRSKRTPSIKNSTKSHNLMFILWDRDTLCFILFSYTSILSRVLVMTACRNIITNSQNVTSTYHPHLREVDETIVCLVGCTLLDEG